MVEDAWSPTASISIMKYFIADYSKHKAILQQLYFVGEFLQGNVGHIVLWTCTEDM